MSEIKERLFHSLFGPHAEPHEPGPYMPPSDWNVIRTLLVWRQPQTVLEIGVNLGATSRAMLNACDAIEYYIGVDVPPDFMPALASQQTEVKSTPGSLVADDRFQLRIVKGGSATLMPADLGMEFDFIFIDGSHARADVAHDTALARAVSGLGDIILWHDYGMPGCEVSSVLDALNEAEGDHICRVIGTAVCFELRRNVERMPSR